MVGARSPHDFTTVEGQRNTRHAFATVQKSCTASQKRCEIRCEILVSQKLVMCQRFLVAGFCCVHPSNSRATIRAIARGNGWIGSRANSAQTQDGTEILALALYGAIDTCVSINQQSEDTVYRHP